MNEVAERSEETSIRIEVVTKHTKMHSQRFTVYELLPTPSGSFLTWLQRWQQIRSRLGYLCFFADPILLKDGDPDLNLALPPLPPK